MQFERFHRHLNDGSFRDARLAKAETSLISVLGLAPPRASSRPVQLHLCSPLRLSATSSLANCSSESTEFVPCPFVAYLYAYQISQYPSTVHQTSTMAPRNPTGFDMREFKAAASPSSVWAKRDPWARKYDMHLIQIQLGVS